MQNTKERKDREIGIGTISKDLPSVYDFVQPLIDDFLANSDDWPAALSLPNRNGPQILVDSFLASLQNPPYTELIRTCCQGWIKEKGVSYSITDEIRKFGHALEEHLQTAEKRWGVTWLTSARPIEAQGEIPSQEQREIPALRDYLDKYKSAGRRQEFWLDAAGDFLINYIRKTTPPEVYAQWQAKADAFVAQAQFPVA